MPLVDIAELRGLVPTGTVLVGLDLGTRTIGVAVSDLSLRFSTPRLVIQRVKFGLDAAVLMKLLDEVRCGGLVLGLPLNMDGSEGPRAQSTRGFARNYVRLDPRPLVLWDERLSTVAAERGMIEMDVSRAKRAARIDAAAASFILQGALDRLSALEARREA